VAVPGDEVGTGVGLAGGDRQLDDRAVLVDDVCPDDRARRMAGVGQLLLDDRVALVADVPGLGERACRVLLDLGAMALAVVGELELGDRARARRALAGVDQAAVRVVFEEPTVERLRWPGRCYKLERWREEPSGPCSGSESN